MKPEAYLAVLAALLLAGSSAAEGPRPPQHGGSGDHLNEYLSQVPPIIGGVMLGRPTDRGITANVLTTSVTVQALIEYNTMGTTARRTSSFELRPGEPREVVLDGLEPNCAYEYRVVNASTGAPLLPEKMRGTFHTQRPRGSEFEFTVQADSHLDGNSAADVYEQTLENVAKEKPDFHIDLGDTFMTGKIVDRTAALKQYLAQRYYLARVSEFAPVFLTIGNHDGEEAGTGRGGQSMQLAAWSCMQRKRFFSNPEPNLFYSGDSTERAGVGRLQDYYAWEWGDALLIVLDPYWYSGGTRGGNEPWGMTLGKEQYDWLASTLRRSNAPFKFVFIHQLVGGLDAAGRGGAEAAPLFEWGGHEKDGRYTFAQNRPGWGMPIHNLLVETGVTIVFHGHDHFFAHQVVDGVVYQLVPQPANPNARKDQAREYGYVTGDFLPSSGRLVVRVRPEQVQVDYVKTVSSGMAKRKPPNESIAFTYTRQPKRLAY